MFAALVALSFLASNPSVTYLSRAAPMRQIVRELDERFGAHLAVSDALSREPVIVTVHDMPIDTLVANLATVLHADIQQLGDLTKIVRTEGHQLALQNAELKSSEDHFRADVQRLYNQQPSDWTQAGLEGFLKDDDKGFFAGPVPWLLATCLSCIDPNEVARIPVLGRRVFSLHPTRQQVHLGNSAASALKDLTRLQKLWIAAGRKVVEAARDPGWNGEKDPEDLPFPLSYPWDQWKAIAFEPTDVQVTIGRFPGGQLSVLLNVKQGDRVRIRCDASDFRFSLQTEMAWYPAPAAGVFEPLDSRLLAWANPLTAHRPNRLGPAWDQLRNYFTGDEIPEPLQLLTSEAMFSIARWKECDVIACLEDEAEGITARSIENGQLSPDRMDAIFRRGGMSVSYLGNCALYSPSLPLTAERGRVNRAKLVALLRRTRATGRVPLEAWTSYLEQANPDQIRSTEDWMDQLFELAPPRSDPEWSTAQLFYSSLSQTQRARLATGGTLRVSDLTSSQRDLADRTLYGAVSNHNWYRRSDYSEESGEREPTEDFPGGFLANGRIVARVKTEEIIQAIDISKSKDYVFRSINLNRPAVLILSNAPKPPERGEVDTRYRLLKMRSVKLGIEVSPGLFLRANIDEEPTGKAATPVPLAKFPVGSGMLSEHSQIDFHDLLGHGSW